MPSPELMIANFNRSFTGVSATAAAVARQQIATYDAHIIGVALPGLPAPIPLRAALALARNRPVSRPFAIWHVRRNSEMQAALFARDILRLPIRIVFTSAAQRRHSLWPRFLISRMDAVIATTPQAAEHVGNVWAVVPHGVDTDLFRPAADRAAAWAGSGFPGTRGIAAIGRIRPEKGTDRFVAAMIRALPDLPGATALVIGRAKREHERFLADLKSRIAAAGLQDRILFTGELPPEAVVKLLPGLSLLVALPRYEGYGMTPLEAMACGVPVVASDVGYFREFLDQDAAGQIIPQGDPGAAADAAADAVLGILTAPEKWAAMAASARHRTETAFSVTTEAAGIAAVYERLWDQG